MIIIIMHKTFQNMLVCKLVLQDVIFLLQTKMQLINFKKVRIFVCAIVAYKVINSLTVLNVTFNFGQESKHSQKMSMF